MSKPLPFASGILAGAKDAGKVFIWKEPNDEVRLLITGRRQLVTATDFHVVVDDDSGFFAFKPSVALANGDASDVVFVSPQPVRAKRRVIVNVIVEGRHQHLGAFHVERQQLVAQNTPSWSIASEFPLRIADAVSATRRSEAAAVLANFKASKNDWPKLCDPAIATDKNLDLPIPGIEFRQRVQGAAAVNGDPDGARFLEGGYEHLKLILRIGEVYGARYRYGFAALDWGVGCGRIARHMPPELQRGLVGIDVDPINIGWCQKHIPFGRYECVDPYSRTPFDDGAFDLIYSHSVLTHLSEQDQFLWLTELARICRGFMILSVHGPYSAQTAPWARKPEEMWDYLVQGYRSSGRENPDIRDVTPAGYYRDAAHTPAYIVANWNRFVQVVDIIPGGFGSLHDAVVCRPIAA